MNLTIEQRLAAVEKAIIELKLDPSPGPTRPSWLERFRGSFQNQPAFAEVVEYGRQWRQADRPEEEGDS